MYGYLCTVLFSNYLAALCRPTSHRPNDWNGNIAKCIIFFAAVCMVLVDSFPSSFAMVAAEEFKYGSMVSSEGKHTMLWSMTQWPMLYCAKAAPA